MPIDNASINYKTKNLRIVAEVLQQEVHKRSLIRWKTNVADCPFNINLVLTSTISYNEEYIIKQRAENKYEISGKTIRALLYGVGKFMRCLDINYEIDYDKKYKPTLAFREKIDTLTSKPNYALRGHRVSYHPKSHSYDAITLDEMKQEILEHVLFGCNTIEMVAPHANDRSSQSPHFTQPWLERMTAITEWCERLDVFFSLWFPVYRDNTDWHDTYKALKRLDTVFLAAGHSADLQPGELFKIVHHHSPVAKQYFPNVKIWVSHQFGLGASPVMPANTWDPRKKLNEFYNEVDFNKEIINGVVYGPWTGDTVHEFRKRIPEELPIRFYPDLCHNMKSPHPVGPRWDVTFALAYGRESINPRPKYFADVFGDVMQSCRYGASCYSEGCADDVNKHVWSGLLWGAIDVSQVIKDYARWYLGDDEVAELVFDLEQNWLQPLKSAFVLKTLEKTIRLHQKLPPRIERNWRWQMLCFRAFHDAFLYMRQHGNKANDSLAWPMARGDFMLTLKACERQLEEVEYVQPSEIVLYGRLEASAAMLHALVGMQLDVKRYGSMNPERGGHLKLLEYLPTDDGVKKGPFTVCGLGEATGGSSQGLVVDYADPARKEVRQIIANMPTRYLSFYCCIAPTALPLQIDIVNSNNSKQLEIVYVGEDLLLEGGDQRLLERRALPTRCMLNGDLLHDYQKVTKTTRRHCFKIPPNMPTIHLQWDVKNRHDVSYVNIPIPVADVRMLP